MIGIRGLLLGLLAVATAGAAVGSGGPDPSVELSATRLVVERGTTADAALAAVEAALERSLAAARRGTARVVTGHEPPRRQFQLAAAALREEGEPAAGRAIDALAELAAARRAQAPAAAGPHVPVSRGELASIAAQLDATGDAGDDFATMRRRAADATDRLDRALAALDGGDPGTAAEEVAASRAALRAVEAWPAGLPTLPLWIETADAMIGAVEALVDAVTAGDAARAEEAAEAFAAASDEAVVAGRALRIAISEGGSAIAAPVLGRLARALEAVQAARAELAAIVQTARR
jgi:hypothetical protein